MPGNLSDGPALLIVSDTAMWTMDEEIIVFEPVVREVESLIPFFSGITWLGYEYEKTNRRKNARAVRGMNVKYLLLPRAGGNDFLSKLGVLATIPRCFWTTWKATRQAQVIHSRGPSLPAFFCILISFFDYKKVYWHKYAGNWDATDKPLFYGLQKFLLLRNKTSIVSINGKWRDQLPHILSLENPCLTDDELRQANSIGEKKDFSGKLVLLFVGRITEAKGVGILLEMLSLISDKSRIGKVYLVGDGDISSYQSRALSTTLDIQFTGAQPREELNRFYTEAHVFLLPSFSEGFPKVVAEAAAFGCVPVVSDVSSLGQYITTENGLLFASFNPKEMALQLETLTSDPKSLELKSMNARKMAQDFTYSRFQNRINREVISRRHIK